MPKHRRYEAEPSLTPADAQANAQQYWPDAVGYMEATTRRTDVHVRVGPGGYVHGYASSSGYRGGAADQDWEAPPEEYNWQEWEGWQGWRPQPALHPDHPSAPVPRIELSADHPSGPWSGPRPRSAPDLPPRRSAGPARGRGAAPRTPAGSDERSPRFHAVRGRDIPTAGHPGSHGRVADTDSLRMAGNVLNLADSKAAQIAQQAQNEAAALREAAERDAVTIREAAARDAAEMRAKLDSMLTELSRVAAYLTETYDIPAMPATAPALPGPARPDTSPTGPDTSPAGPDTGPARPARQAGPRTTPTRAPAKPAGKQQAKPTGKPSTAQQRQGRQKRAMRFAKYGTAAAVIFALTAGAAQIGQHGYNFFVFRENGQGDTPNVQPGRAGDNRLDTDFLAQQAKAAEQAKAHQALKGRHHKTSPSAPKGTTTSSTTGG